MKGTIRTRGRDTWQLVYDLPPGPDGKRKQKTETVRGPKKAAQIRLREVLGAVDQGRVADAGKMTVGQYMDEWLAGLERAESTLERYESVIRVNIKPAIGHIRLSALTALQLETFYRNQREKLASASVRMVHAILSKALGRAVKLGLINRNPCADVEALPKLDKREVRFLTPEQKHRFITATVGSYYRPLLLTALATGMRLSELRGLHWKDVDLKAGVIHVRRMADRHNKIVDHLKSKASRRNVTIPPVLVEILKAHHQYLLEEKLRLRPIWQDLGLVFPRPDGGVLRINAIGRPLESICKKAGVDVHFHGLRHTHASDLIAANVHAKVISERLGHSSIKITLDRYSHLFPGAQDEAAAAIDAILRASV
jgi:integrase